MTGYGKRLVERIGGNVVPLNLEAAADSLCDCKGQMGRQREHCEQRELRGRSVPFQDAARSGLTVPSTTEGVSQGRPELDSENLIQL